MGPVAQNIFDQIGEHPLGADFHKNSAACRVNVLDFLAKIDRLEDMGFQRLFNRFGLTGIRFRAGIAVDGDARRGKVRFVDGLGERLLGVAHKRSVERGRDRQRRDHIPIGA